jgi:hypothetical protein
MYQKELWPNYLLIRVIWLLENLHRKQTITFTYITPGKYKLRFVEDLNQNGTWDTGNYLKKIQPERIFEFTEGKNKGEINIRANWENEISFSIPKP